ncbi:MAG: TIGR02253 family HAD-type hydrolase [Candidatus Micrarchaeia archaeon]
MVKAILFDIDNTLFPSSEFAELARKNALNAMIAAGLDVDEEAAYRKLLKIINKYGPNYPKHFNALLRELGKKSEPKIIAAGVVAYHQTKASIFPFPDVPKTVIQLREQGYTICVASEGRAIKQWDKLIRLGLHNLFHYVFVTPKKTKKFYSSILKKLRMQPHDVVMVGDSVEKDIEPAKEAGITTVLLSKKKNNADYNITAIKELIPILQELRK